MRTSKSFTIIELLVVVAIIALLVSLLLPSLRRAQELTHRSVCRNNERLIAVACMAFAEGHDGYGPEESPQEAPIFQMQLAPYWGQDPIAKPGEPGTPDARRPYWGTTGCPSYRRGTKPMTFYDQALAINSHLCGQGHQRNLSDIDVPSEVALVVESTCSYQTGDFFGLIYETANGSPNGQGGWSVWPRHQREGLNFAFLDTHAAFLGYYRKGSAETFLPKNPRAN